MIICFYKISIFTKQNVNSLINYNPEYSLKIKNNEENINLEWYSSYILSDNSSFFFLISTSSNNDYLLKIVSLDGYFEVIDEKINQISQNKNIIIFDHGFIRFDEAKIYFEYKNENIDISLNYSKINKGFYSKRSTYEEYFKEYHVLSSESEVDGHVKVKDNFYLVSGLGYFDHMWGFWPQRKWVWGWIPNINNKSLIFAYSDRNENNNIIGKIMILSDKNEVLSSDIKIEREGNKIKIDSDSFDISLVYNIPDKNILEGFNPFKIDYFIKLKDQTINTEGIIEYMNIDE